jgi:hypothetical protein
VAPWVVPVYEFGRVANAAVVVAMLCVLGAVLVRWVERRWF